MNEKELVQLSAEAKENSYSPYSSFRVGAAVVAESGRVYTGTNIENATYGATCCAERVAVFNAVASGEKSLSAIAISSDSNDYIMPCGICRQVLTEFGNDDLKLYCSKNSGEYIILSLGDLLPRAFRPQQLKDGKSINQ